MKKCLCTILILGFANFCFSQENFEGVISYKLNIENINRTWYSLKVYYKQNRILVQTFAGEDSTVANEEKIFDFESGFSYMINKDERTILQDSLIKSENKSTLPIFFNDSLKKILNYNCKLIKYDSINLKEDISDDVCLWFAESLKFNLPEKYYPFTPCLLFTNGKSICLSAYFSAFLTRNGKARLNIRAEMINKIQLADSIFSLPKGFSIQQLEYPPKIELSEIKIDEIKREPLPPPPLSSKAKIKKKISRKKTPQKSSAIKPKQ
jgi:hypothetical protein